nr:hypothetical protein [Tanacetum cinerariifolium]
SSDSPLLGVNTPRSDEDRLKLMELMVFLLQKDAVIREILQLNDAEGVDVAHVATPSPPPHGIPFPPQELSSPPQQPYVIPPAPIQEDDSEVQEVVEVVTIAKLITKVVTAAASQVSAVSITIPAAIAAAYTRRRKGVTIRDPEEELPLKTPAETPKVKDKGNGILVEAP